MKYSLDINGYVDTVLWGCNTGTCQEYTGNVPTGYATLVEWASNAIINAYYIDSSGNLTLDAEREAELRIRAEQQAADYSPVLRKDLFDTQEALNTQYIKKRANGNMLQLSDVLNLPPAVKITHIDPSRDSLTIFAQNENMLKLSAKETTISGLTFGRITQGDSKGAISITGIATEAVEYTIAGSSNNAIPIFALMKDSPYYLWVSGCSCEMRYFDGETTEIVYSGSGGVITIPDNKSVTEVVLKFSAGYSADGFIVPSLNYGPVKQDYVEANAKTLTLDISKYVKQVMYPSESLFPGITTITTGVDYIAIKDGVIIISFDSVKYYIGSGNLMLLNGFNNVYTDQFNDLDIEYATKDLVVDDLKFLQGKATTTNKFKILEDGSIEAHNGIFSGKVTADSGEIGGWHVDGTSLWCYIIPPADFTQSDVDKIEQYIIKQGTLTDEEMKLYDLNNDGVVSSVDCLFVERFILHGLTRSNPGKLILDTSDWFKPIKVVNSNGVAISWFGPGGAGEIEG